VRNVTPTTSKLESFVAHVKIKRNCSDSFRVVSHSTSFSPRRRDPTTRTVASPLLDARDERESNKNNLNTGWVIAAGDSGRSLVTAGVFLSYSSGGKTARAWNERCARGVVGDHGTAPVDRPASGHRDKRGGCACEKGRRDRVGERG